MTWVYTVCLGPIYGMPGIYRFIRNYLEVQSILLYSQHSFRYVSILFQNQIFIAWNIIKEKNAHTNHFLAFNHTKLAFFPPFFPLQSWLIFELGHEKTCLMSYANNKGADQPAHLRSLISAFVVRCLRQCNVSSFCNQNFKAHASFCSWAGQFESDMFSRDEAHLNVYNSIHLKNIFKNSDTRKITVIVQKLEHHRFTTEQLVQKMQKEWQTV